MPDQPTPASSVTAVMRLVGPQRTYMAVQHGGTPEAYVAITVGRSVIYMHTKETAERLGTIWREAHVEALQLPRARPITVSSTDPPDLAEPSVVVHTAGQPAASVRLSAATPRHLSVNIGGIAFLIYDKRAFVSVAEQFVRAMAAGRELLPTVDSRRWAAARAEPALAGEAAARAAQELLNGDRHGETEAAMHPALRAVRGFRPTHPISGAGHRGSTQSAESPRPRLSAARLGLNKPADRAPGMGR